ncbi:MAG TPA: serine/threonine-protein kinase, partial [Acidobacteriaceae bacterium]|nr:serine/threonine-protein kinase [Acidobacteriaceae bacterium]
MAFEIGQRVGDYEIVSMLGVGGMGRVYRVRNVISDRTEAMKVLLPDLVAEPDLAVRFISEIRMLASFDHPNIAQLHTAFQVDNQLVMMMEFVEGFTLEQRAKQGPIPQSDIINYMQQVLGALSYAHGRGVVHRDIKPANIMVTSHGVVKLMDFGIAKSRVEQDLTRPGTTMGSMYYMSPEQVRGGTVDARSDIYSVGVMMYELFAGRRPFVADSAYGILNQQCNVAPQPPVELNQQLPPALSDLILCALAKDPANRFQNAQAVSNALRQIAAQNETPNTEVTFTPVVVPGSYAGSAAGAAPSADPGFAAAPVAAYAGPSSGHRGAWITVGALAVLVIVAAAAVGLPHLFHTSAKTESDGDRIAQTAPAAPSP